MVDIVFDGDITGSGLRVAGAPINSITLSAAGNVTYPSSVSSSLYLSTNASLVTGDSTPYPVVMDTYVSGGNVGSAYNLTTGVFTAPVAGVYNFDFSLYLDGIIELIHTLYLYMTIDGFQTDILSHGFPSGIIFGGGKFSVPGSVTRYMGASTTAQLFVDVIGGAKTVSVLKNDGTNIKTWFTARLLG